MNVKSIVIAVRTLLSVLIVTASLSAASAQPAGLKKLAFTDPKMTDADFAYQGEYLGTFVEDGYGRQIGLQVVAQGDATFLGVEYDGGLPGTGWNKRTKYKMTTRIKDGIVRLESPKHVFLVVPEAAEVQTKDGRKLGSLQKVERVSATLGKKPPTNAVVLFNGKDTSHFKAAKMTKDRLLQEGTETVKAFKDFHLHIEFLLPYMPHARGQGRANSGVYIQSRYEVQILDSFGLDGIHNECAGLYRQKAPALNMCLSPLKWQTYDITFRSPKFDAAGKKTANARITVRHNGVLVHDNYELKSKTGAGRPEGPNPLVTKLQNHGNPVRFRNIWLIELDPQPTQLANAK